MTSVSEVIVSFLQVILFANTAAFFCFLLRSVLHSFWEADSLRKLARDGVASKRSITYAMAYKRPAFHAYSHVLDIFIYACDSANLDSFVISFFFS